MVFVSILPHVKFGRYDHREDTTHFRFIDKMKNFSSIIINNKQNITNPTSQIVFANRQRVIEIKNHQKEFERQSDLENLLKESNIQLQN